MDDDYFISLIVIGNSQVGKSKIIKRIIEDSYDDKQINTKGVDLFFKSLQLDKSYIKTIIYDLSEHQRFRGIVEKYLNNCQCLILVYDITNIQTFNDLKDWITIITK